MQANSSPVLAQAPSIDGKSGQGFKMTQADIDFFHENGYLVVRNALAMQEVEALRGESLAVCKGERGQLRGVTPPAAGESDEDILKRTLCIHMPHKISDHLMSYMVHPVIKEVLSSVIGPNVKAMQSMLFIKASGKPGQAWHQDEDYIPTRDRSLAGAWIAMDDATVENGCLWVIPGSHKRGVLYPQKWHANSGFDCSLEAYEFPYSDSDAVPVEVKAGSVVFFNGYLLHRSLQNVAKTGFRRCLVNHYMSAESFLPWYHPKEGEGIAKLDHRDIVMVCGQDPYAYKGLTDVTEAHVRPSGEGGCGNNKYNLKRAPGADDDEDE